MSKYQDKNDTSIHYDYCPHCGDRYRWTWDEPDYCPHCGERL